MNRNSYLISHNNTDNLELSLKAIKERLMREGDKPYASLDYELNLLQQLSEFDFGRFLLCNQGVNGYWTDYMLMYPVRGRKTGHDEQGRPLSSLERFILDKSPIMLATQQRLAIFFQENQKMVRDGAALACIPSGMMGELLYLNYHDIHQIKLVGIDFDPAALACARRLGEKNNLIQWMELKEGDAWQLEARDEFDLISSNGLTIYEPNDEKIAQLFQLFYNALKKNGKLVTSFLTPPPTLTEHCEWDFNHINQDDLLLQKILFVDIIQTKFQCYRSSLQTKQQLEAVGFEKIEFIYDKAKFFPTVVAYKS
jgi:SAM-dependent methyltransferase